MKNVGRHKENILTSGTHFSPSTPSPHDGDRGEELQEILIGTLHEPALSASIWSHHSQLLVRSVFEMSNFLDLMILIQLDCPVLRSLGRRCSISGVSNESLLPALQS